MPISEMVVSTVAKLNPWPYVTIFLPKYFSGFSAVLRQFPIRWARFVFPDEFFPVRIFRFQNSTFIELRFLNLSTFRRFIFINLVYYYFTESSVTPESKKIKYTQ
jgi:hypothetical protein